MKILVTGATGFIGRELVSNLQDSYEILVLVRSSSDITKLKEMSCSIVKYDKYIDIINIFEKEKIEGVVHIASNIVAEHESKQLDELLSSNISYGTYLLEASKKTNVKWFINTGTFWQNFESEKYNPVNLYAATKEALEVIAKYYTETSELIFTTIKLNDTFGPNDTRPKIFNLWNKIAKTGKRLDMSQGKQIIDISYIEDIIEAYKILIGHLCSKEKNNFKNQTYAVKSNERMTLVELANLFESVTNKKLNINWGGRKYRNREVMIPLENIKIVPNWKQKYKLEDAIKKMILGEVND